MLVGAAVTSADLGYIGLAERFISRCRTRQALCDRLSYAPATAWLLRVRRSLVLAGLADGFETAGPHHRRGRPDDVDPIVGQSAGHGLLLAIGLSPDTDPAEEVGVVGDGLGVGVVGDGVGVGVVGDGLGVGVVGDDAGLADPGGGDEFTNADGEDTLLLGVLSALVGVALP